MFNNICFDVETGGFNADVNPITEFACIVYNPITFEKLFEFETIVKPYHGLILDDGATKVTGLSYERCMDEGADAKELVDVMKYILETFTVKHGKWSEKPVFVGHNIVKFDKFFIEKLFAIYGDKLYKYADDYMIDTLHDARLKWPNKKGHKLGDCCKYIGYDLVDAHRAMPDVVANTHLHHYFLSSLRNENSGTSTTVTQNFRSTFQL